MFPAVNQILNSILKRLLNKEWKNLDDKITWDYSGVREAREVRNEVDVLPLATDAEEPHNVGVVYVDQNRQFRRDLAEVIFQQVREQLRLRRRADVGGGQPVRSGRGDGRALLLHGFLRSLPRPTFSLLLC